MRNKPIYPFRISMKHRTETGLCLTDRQPSMTALVALWDQDYGFWLYDYEQVPRRRYRDKAVIVRDHFISARCSVPEELFLGDLSILPGTAELRFEWKPFAEQLLRELLWWTFGSYSPLQLEASRVYGYNPNVYSGEESLGTLREIISELSALHADVN
jgi:hypothetical protein